MESYAKVGRGGAGNYYSPRDIQEAASKLHEDVESQQHNAGAEALGRDSSRAEYVHAGRGGAGNYQPTAPTVTGTTNELSTSLKQGAIPEGGYAGRGGAGNFRGSIDNRESEAMIKANEAAEKLYEEAVKDVEQGLKQPEKAHIASEKVGEL